MSAGQAGRRHDHYFKDVSHLSEIDVYRVLQIFGVTDPAIAHAAKKLLVAGGRGSKDISQDIQEAIDALVRWQEMKAEDVPQSEIQACADGLIGDFIVALAKAGLPK